MSQRNERTSGEWIHDRLFFPHAVRFGTNRTSAFERCLSHQWNAVRDIKTVERESIDCCHSLSEEFHLIIPSSIDLEAINHHQIVTKEKGRISKGVLIQKMKINRLRCFVSGFSIECIRSSYRHITWISYVDLSLSNPQDTIGRRRK